MAQTAYRYLSWRGATIESAQCGTCLASDGGHEDWCGAPTYRDFDRTEQAELAWLNARLDAINAERASSGTEDLHWQEHRSICRSLKALVSGAEVDADVWAAINALRALTSEQRQSVLADVAAWDEE